MANAGEKKKRLKKSVTMDTPPPLWRGEQSLKGINKKSKIIEMSVCTTYTLCIQSESLWTLDDVIVMRWGRGKKLNQYGQCQYGGHAGGEEWGVPFRAAPPKAIRRIVLGFFKKGFCGATLLFTFVKLGLIHTSSPFLWRHHNFC